jgi:hypothetical protein
MDLETKARLLEIPRLVEVERARLAEIGETMEKLEAERKMRLAMVLELQREELAIMRTPVR